MPFITPLLGFLFLKERISISVWVSIVIATIGIVIMALGNKVSGSLFGLIFGLISGNSNIIKVPSKKFDQVDIICQVISKILKN